MRIFVTGGTGFIGSVVVKKLMESGHQVLGLARSAISAEALRTMGAEVLEGSIEQLDILKMGALSSDAVIHMAFNNDFSDYAAAVEEDLLAVTAIGEALIDSNKPFVVTSGTLGVSNLNRFTTEDDIGDYHMPRIAAEHKALEYANKGVRVSIVRLPPCVHDTNRLGFVTQLMKIALEKGKSAYIGDGENRWPAIHTLDAAELFCRAIESAPAGTRLHAVAEESIPLKSISEVIGKKYDLPVMSIAMDEALTHFGWFANVVGIDNPTSSVVTKELLAWKPINPTLFEDIMCHKGFDKRES